MSNIRQFTAIIEREEDGYVALCPELDIASQGDTVEQARTNLIEALELFFEVADPSEVKRRELCRNTHWNLNVNYSPVWATPFSI